MDSGQARLASHHQPVCRFDEERHIYTIDGRYVPGVTKLLEVGGYINKEDYRRYPNAAIRGKAIHLACELLDAGELDWTSITDEGLPYVMAYELFLKESGFVAEKEWTERRMFNTTLLYGGTMDRRGKFPMASNRAIIDLKTGSVSDWAALQTAGYETLMPEEDGPFDRYALRLSDDGRYKLVPFKKRSDKRLFLTLVEHYWEKVSQGIVKENGELKWKIL